jgi:SAM-dependent methyltransferase
MATCRSCGARLASVFCDLGATPLANAYLSGEKLDGMEATYPLRAYVCDECHLVQLPELVTPAALFSDYAYFSSYSTAWLAHAEKFVGSMVERLGLDETSLVVEIASNDGHLLRRFVERRIPVLGVEPALNVARVAESNGVPTIPEFFGRAVATRLSRQHGPADLIVANNVLAHVPDINDFVSGIRVMLAPEGTATIEFPHLLTMIKSNEFDTIYHEHYSYLSLVALEGVFDRHGLAMADVQELETHGGSLRVFLTHSNAARSDDGRKAVDRVLAREVQAGLTELHTGNDFAERVARVKRQLLSFLIAAKEDQQVVVGYGAAAKANTLLNYCGIGPDLLAYTADRSPHKQGRYLPGTRIPVVAPSQIDETRPAYVLILAWNWADEIMAQLSNIRSWGGKFVVPIPALKVLDDL